MNGDRKEHFERLFAGLRDMKAAAADLEADLGNGPIAHKARQSLAEDIACARRLMYQAMYGDLPPVDLPENWEGEP
jgi:hypothetical protein